MTQGGVLRVLDLFSGIGGFSLGLERAGGFRTVAFCEIEPYPRAVLARHWPEVPCYHDVRELTAARLAADGIAVDAICGGFPCQDISTAGKGAGLAGERSGLWREIARLVGELRPRVVIVENVSALLGRGLGDVLGDLAALGYDAEWHCIPASAVGAPHRRDRIWIVGYPNGEPGEWRAGGVSGAEAPISGARQPDGGVAHRLEYAGQGGGSGIVAYPSRERREKGGELRRHESTQWASGRRQDVADAELHGRNGAKVEGSVIASQIEGGLLKSEGRGWWASEPDVGRVADGVPARVDRIAALGNAVVPQVVEVIGRAINQARGWPA